MAQQTINIGTVANDGTGDPARTAFNKVNNNTTELYGRTWPSVKEYGAVGNGSTDDSAAIQAAINASANLFFPAGNYRVNSTLTFPEAPHYGGGVWLGAGIQFHDPRVVTYSGQTTSMTWGGAAGGTMIHADGVFGMQIRGMNFVGHLTFGHAADLEAGNLWYVTAPLNVSAGYYTFDNVGFYDAVNAVNCGEDASAHNCADMSFHQGHFGFLTRGLYVKHAQGAGYTFVIWNAEDVTHLAHFEQGGNIRWYGGNIAACGGTGADDYMFRFDDMGLGNGVNIIEQLRLEVNSKRFLRANGAAGIVRVSNIQESGASQDIRLIDIHGATVHMEGCLWITHNITNPTFAVQNDGPGEKGSLFVSKCKLVGDGVSDPFLQNEWVSLSDGNDDAIVKFYDNQFGPYLWPARDFCNKLEYGSFTAFCNTTGNTPTVCTFDGAAANTSNSCRVEYGSTSLVEVYTVGRKSDGSVVGSFTRRAMVKDVAGTSSLVGSVETIGTDQNAGGWGGVAVTVTNGRIVTTVTGLAATTIDWRTTVKPLSIDRGVPS